MAPSSKADPKQKSLMSFFGKGKAADSGPSTSAGQSKRGGGLKPAASRPKTEPKTPANTRQTKPAVCSSTSFKASHNDTPPPPSSDFIDVDMVTDDEVEKSPIVQKTRPSKRKIVVDDSDEEVVAATSKSGKTPVNSSTNLESRTKRPRLSVPPSSDDFEEEDGDGIGSTFSGRLTHFKKSPAKSRRKSLGNASDDDDFIAPSDSDEIVSAKSKSSRAGSSASSRVSEGDDDEEDDARKTKKKSVANSKKIQANASAGPSQPASEEQSMDTAFLTAAEKREQGKKNEKKSAENPYAFLQDLQDKDRKRPGDPQYDPRTLYIPAAAWKTFTPFEKQFWEIKQNHYDTILFFQKGKFLELYEEDARIGHREFDLKLTHRVKMSMVGVPEMSFAFWASKFLGKGYKVGRVDQAETALGAEMRMAAAKGKGNAKEDKIVRRELNKVFTNGTLVDAELLTEDQGHCISIQQDSSETTNRFGVCILDCSTSQFNLSAFEDDVCLTKLDTLLRQLKPKEILHTKGALSVAVLRLLKSILPVSCLWTVLRTTEGLGFEQTLHELKQLYPDDSDIIKADEDDTRVTANTPAAIRTMVNDQGAIVALGNMIWYLKTLNIAEDILTMKSFDIYDPMQQGAGLTLDGQSLSHLEILLNNEGTEEGSLLELLQRCVTPFGKRLFRIWLTLPLREVSAINARLDAVGELMDHPTFEGEFLAIAKGLPDLERVVSRIHAKSSKVKDFLRVMAAFKKLTKGMADLAADADTFKSKTVSGLLRSAPDLLPHIKNVEKMYNKPSGDKDNDDFVPREGQDEVYDQIEAEIAELEEQLEEELKKYQKNHKFPLTYWHSAQGNKEIYLVQTKAGEKPVPKDWKKEASTKSVTRYRVPALEPTIRLLKEAKENRKTAVKNFAVRVFVEFDTDRAVWLRTIRIFAELDCLFSLAKSSLAVGEPSCRPELIAGDSAHLEFDELRHPTLSNRTGAFIPNDVKLGGRSPNVALITGANMAGKSTLMRMTATAVIMAQLGMHVPASRAVISPCDSIITRMGAYDNMFSNASTFKVELDECCKILRDATPSSLVILDELGRGTSTYDGMAIAGAVLHQLATHTLSLAFFATHYGSLTDDYSYHPNIRNMHMSALVDEEKRDLVFLFKLVEGVASGSFGTHVANLAGVPSEVVERASVVSKEFSRQFADKLEVKRQRSASSKLPVDAQADVAYLINVATGKLQLPLNAFRQREVLARLKEIARTGYIHK